MRFSMRRSVAIKPAARPVRVYSSPRSFHVDMKLQAGFDKRVKHQDSEENNKDLPFEFNKENWALAKKIIAKYPPGYQRAATIPLLDLAQRQYGGWLPLSAMHKVAQVLSLQPMQVYETASFYTMFNRSPVGKHFVQVCGTTPCQLRGFNDIMKACEEELGACVHAPMMQIGDDYFEDLTPENTKQILRTIAQGGQPKTGSYIGRIVAEPIGGRTTLKEPPMGPYAPFLESLDQATKTSN